ncbi:Uncharacterized conserved protein UCP033563 [Desulfotomaculum nigrificans CO-1-SRB]|uniref:Uncharacterized conserved protein UCP033563 n=1 Tax=Desulfotomaculum nigrificans (strain DSM 14880 / VKM B-2319 / CO-1-SRB) TaxID=868595 RepID=F6BA07_DESCC|nr:DUF1015 family protein [Desulfotomaculum nigrificans]AEF94976.1 Uncharacterized conserved protein UCP033563 [Desulfotomaculum nigrificans CO-1-SRB]
MVIKELGVQVPTVLLPQEGIDLTKWSVVACDQYTSEPAYWARVAQLVGDAPSTLHLIFPEVYLEQDDRAARIQKINNTMQEYLTAGMLVEHTGFILVDRQTSNAASRKGLVMALDLEQYDYHRGAQTLIRATEGTVLDRLPPRIKIREHAPIELPHIMVLIDDPDRTVIEPVAEQVGQLKKLYDFDLMLDGGHVKGYLVDQPAIIDGVLAALAKLADPTVFQAKYGVGPDKGVLLFAMGDGNHSLATAKAVWENLKKSLTPEELANHPARYALVEIVNVHDDGLTFEPIHRVVFNTEPRQLLDKMVQYFNQHNGQAYDQSVTDQEAFQQEADRLRKLGYHVIPYLTARTAGVVVIKNPRHNLEAGSLQSCLNELATQEPGLKIDYIHGADVVRDLAAQDGTIGFYLPPMSKHDLFKTVILDGALPRKTFSMGEAQEKRFYLECRKIK